MIDLRHHIYSLVAVFLALAAGMFIGKAFEPVSPMERQQSRISHLNRVLERLEADFTTLRNEVVDQQGQIKELEGENKRSDEYCRALVPLAVKGRLQWKNIAIIQTGDYGEDTAAVKAVLEQAGAKVTSVTQINKLSDVSDADKASDILAKCRIGVETEPCRTLFRAISRCVTSSQNFDKLVKLRDAGAISISGDYSKRSSGVVILGGAKETDTSDKVDALLIEELKAAGATVVGCEPFSATVSFIPAYKKAGIASVDNVDKSFGQIGLVCALAGETASFGVKRTADRLMPQTLSAEGVR